MTRHFIGRPSLCYLQHSQPIVSDMAQPSRLFTWKSQSNFESCLEDDRKRRYILGIWTSNESNSYHPSRAKVVSYCSMVDNRSMLFWNRLSETRDSGNGAHYVPPISIILGTSRKITGLTRLVVPALRLWPVRRTFLRTWVGTCNVLYCVV